MPGLTGFEDRAAHQDEYASAVKVMPFARDTAVTEPGRTRDAYRAREQGLSRARERVLLDALVDLADGLVTSYDVDGVLGRLTGHCLELVAAAAAGILLLDDRGRLRVRTASADLRAVELLAVHDNEGPCVECIRTGRPVVVPDLAAARNRWPAWAGRALDDGFRNVYVFPMRLRDEVVGALTLVGTTTAALPKSDLAAVRALADMATITLLTYDSDRYAQRNDQLQAALADRVVVEQATGVIAVVAGVTIDEASLLLHEAARATGTSIGDLSYSVATGQIGSDAVISSASTDAAATGAASSGRVSPDL